METETSRASDPRPGDFVSALDDAIGQITRRLDALNREQCELEASLMSLKDLRGSLGTVPETAKRAILVALLRQGGVPPRVRYEIMHGKPPAAADDEDGPACAEPLTAAECGTNFEKIVQFFLARQNEPATNMDIRTAIGASRGAVATVVYSTHAGRFERPQKRIGGKVAWKLRDDVYQAEMSKAGAGTIRIVGVGGVGSSFGGFSAQELERPLSCEPVRWPETSPPRAYVDERPERIGFQADMGNSFRLTSLGDSSVSRRGSNVRFVCEQCGYEAGRRREGE